MAIPRARPAWWMAHGIDKIEVPIIVDQIANLKSRHTFSLRTRGIGGVYFEWDIRFWISTHIVIKLLCLTTVVPGGGTQTSGAKKGAGTTWWGITCKNQDRLNSRLFDKENKGTYANIRVESSIVFVPWVHSLLARRRPVKSRMVFLAGRIFLD